jgi:hypothetical protein
MGMLAKIPGAWQLLPLLILTANLTGHAPPADANRSAATSSPSTQPVAFLGLGDDEEKKIGDESPQSALAALPRITKVQVSDLAEYARAKKAGRVVAEQRTGDCIYWAVEAQRDVRFPNGSSAMYTITERFKARSPDGAKTRPAAGSPASGPATAPTT